MIKIIYLLLFIIFLITIIIYISKCNEYFTHPNKWCILLTTAVNNDESRKKLYIESINKWLNQTPFHIFIVESSQYTFPEIQNERFHLYTFQVEKSTSSSISEATSIIYLLDQVKDNPLWNSFSHILKVTGRYYLDGIIETLNNLEPNKDLYIQKNREPEWQNSEYFGIRREMMRTLVETILKDTKHFELKLYEFIQDKDTIQMGPFENTIARGGDGLVIRNL
jgi:hypothetical protein